jgi:hypothetical protein
VTGCFPKTPQKTPSPPKEVVNGPVCQRLLGAMQRSPVRREPGDFCNKRGLLDGEVEDMDIDAVGECKGDSSDRVNDVTRDVSCDWPRQHGDYHNNRVMCSNGLINLKEGLSDPVSLERHQHKSANFFANNCKVFSDYFDSESMEEAGQKPPDPAGPIDHAAGFQQMPTTSPVPTRASKPVGGVIFSPSRIDPRGDRPISPVMPVLSPQMTQMESRPPISDTTVAEPHMEVDSGSVIDAPPPEPSSSATGLEEETPYEDHTDIASFYDDPEDKGI